VKEEEGVRAQLSRDRKEALPRLPLRSGSQAALLRNSCKTERGAGQFLVRLAVSPAPFALLRNSCKTVGGAASSWTVLRCAPHPLRFLPVAAQLETLRQCRLRLPKATATNPIPSGTIIPGSGVASNCSVTSREYI
jgi:hypothetical protein